MSDNDAFAAFGLDADLAWTRKFPFIAGFYGFSGERVPYFSATLTVQETLRYLSLAHQIPIDKDDPVHLEELMQRVLDDRRAGEEILKYLTRPSRIKFFNSLTVVLLPTDPNGRVLSDYPHPSRLPPGVADDDVHWSVQKAGGILVRTSVSAPGVGQLMWQPDLVRPVIIDGQHRFSALKQLELEQPALLEGSETSLPILFVAPSAELGFAAPRGAPKTILATSRAIFTDINKNAKTVTSERQYLLDDGSLSAVAMRKILSDGIGGSNAALAERVPARIPLAVVDWTRRGRTRFDDNEHPAITTIQSLHQLVRQTLPSTPGDEDWPKWRDWVSTVDESLNPLTPWIKKDIMGRVETAEQQGTQFVLQSDEIVAAADAYANNVGQIVALPLVRLSPYAQMLAQLRSSDLLAAPDELWLGQDTRGRATYIARYGDTNLQSRATEASRTVKEGSVAYQVVFQRAFVVAAKQACDARIAMAEHWQLSENDLLTVLQNWIDRFNTRVAPHLRDHAFWRGTAIDAAGNMDYVQTPMRGVAGLVLILTVVDWSSVAGSYDYEDVAVLLGQRRDRPKLESVLFHDDEDNEADPAPSPNDTALSILEEDPLKPEITEGTVQRGAQWGELLNQIRRGPAPDAMTALLRVASRWYRESLRRYARSVHLSATGYSPTDEVESAMILALGSRRLAASAGEDPA